MKYVKGDLFDHVGPNKGKKITIIAHVCNDIGAWGAGFVVPLGKKYPDSRDLYLALDQRNLGEIQLVTTIEGGVMVANMIAQHGIGPSFEGDKMIPPIRYDALKQCMYAVREAARIMQQNGYTVEVACPMFGAGLAGGDWPTIEQMIALIWQEQGLPVTIYYLPQFLPPGWTPPAGEDNATQE